MSLSTQQVDRIWNQLRDYYPSLGTDSTTWHAVYPVYLQRSDIDLQAQMANKLDEDYWGTTINFLLLILAAEGEDINDDFNTEQLS